MCVCVFVCCQTAGTHTHAHVRTNTNMRTGHGRHGEPKVSDEVPTTSPENKLIAYVKDHDQIRY